MDKIVQITDDMIIKLWRTGLTVKQITKRYIQSKKRFDGIRLNLIEAQEYVEPIIFEYQKKVMKGEI